MKKNNINLFTPSLFTWSIYEIIYAALFKDYKKIALKISKIGKIAIKIGGQGFNFLIIIDNFTSFSLVLEYGGEVV